MSHPWKIASNPPCVSILLTQGNWLRIDRTWALSQLGFNHQVSQEGIHVKA